MPRALIKTLVYARELDRSLISGIHDLGEESLMSSCLALF